MVLGVDALVKDLKQLNYVDEMGPLGHEELYRSGVDIRYPHGLAYFWASSSR